MKLDDALFVLLASVMKVLVILSESDDLPLVLRICLKIKLLAGESLNFFFKF